MMTGLPSLSVIPVYVMDAFTAGNGERFTGNPAAICVCDYDDDISDEIKQKIAQQMNLSKTAFVAKNWSKISPQKLSQQSNNDYTLRWFTPTNEVELCGHATLAAAFVIKLRTIDGEQQNKTDSKLCLNFHTKFRGILGADIDLKTDRISLNFPSNFCEPLNKTDYEWIDDIISNTLGDKLQSNCVQDTQYSADTKKLLLRLRDENNAENILSEVNPDFGELKKIQTNGLVRGVIVTTKSNRNDIDFMSRYFAPWNGINEDPVTGSAHTVLAPYWLKLLANNNRTVIGMQCSSRTGLICCEVIGDRVILSGTANAVIVGEMRFT